MAHLHDVLREIGDVKELLKVKRKNSDKLVDGLVRSIAAKIATIASWDTGCTVTLSKAIEDSGLHSDLKDVLEHACDARTNQFSALASGFNAKACAGAPARDQFMRHMNNYLTTSDWAVLDDPRSTPEQRDVRISDRLAKLNVTRASEENLIRWAITIALDCENKLYRSWPSYWSILYRVEAFKATLKHYKLEGVPAVYIDKFPENPVDLPQNLYAYAYTPEDPPVHRFIPRMVEVSHHVPLRRTSKLLEKEGEPRPQAQHERVVPYELSSSDQVVMVNGVPIRIFSGADTGIQVEHLGQELYL
jgi:hypothetical protein